LAVVLHWTALLLLLLRWLLLLLLRWLLLLL
jgi:hypothetical protein